VSASLNVSSRIEHPFAITPCGVTVTTGDGITVKVTGPEPISDANLAEMFRKAMKEARRIRKENLR
jgi:hypothetical protein